MSPRLPLFPLPEIVVFPGLLIPLFIFEERYKQLTKDLLAQPEENRRFVIALSGDAIKQVGGYVDLLEAAQNPDGSFNLICRGGERCRLEGVENKLHPYHTTLDRPWPTERGERNLELVAAWDAMDAFREFVTGSADPVAMEEAIGNLPEDPLYQASFLCVNLRLPSAERQELLEAPTLLARFELAQQLMRQHRLDPNNPEA